MEIMSVMEGFTYTELRDMPLDEFLFVKDNVNRIQMLREREMKKR